MLPTTLPTAPITMAKSIEATATVIDEIVLARMTRRRFGTSVNVVRPLRWLHSPVIESRATIGRMMVIGKPIALAKV